MKILWVKGEQITIIADNALLRQDEPFYVPDFAVGGLEVVEGVSARITRLVKCIEGRFAHRAWDEWSECRHHIALGVQLCVGHSFDRSFQVGDFRLKSELPQGIEQVIDGAIAYVSQFISLRVGDYIFIER